MSSRREYIQHETSISIGCPEEQMLVVVAMIDRFRAINNLKFKLDIRHDYSIEERGVYYKGKNMIFVNPNNCEMVTDNEDFANGYTRDLTMFGVAIHEFAHFIVDKLFPKITKEYKKAFPTFRLYLNEYSNKDVDEELAETITLYITNPYLLKLISPDHWKFFKDRFKAPTPCSQKQCFRLYDEFPIDCKEELKERFGVVWNVVNEKFEIQEKMPKKRRI